MNASDMPAEFRSLVRSFFSQQSARLFKPSEIKQIIRVKRNEWRLPKSESVESLLHRLIRETPLRKIRLEFPFRPETRFAWEPIRSFELAASLRKDGYFSHYSAVWLHGLTTEEPESVYFNSEQTEKPRARSTMTQATIDSAFRRPPRITTNVARYENRQIVLLNGKQTGELGVTTVTLDDSTELRVTDVERTLIDIVVRPYYSGGVEEVLRTYRSAASKASGERIAEMLSTLDYVYPYHQAIGFYLERSAAYEATVIDLFAGMPMKFKFYLTHEMNETRYCNRWRVHYPAYLDGDGQ